MKRLIPLLLAALLLVSLFSGCAGVGLMYAVPPQGEDSQTSYYSFSVGGSPANPAAQGVTEPFATAPGRTEAPETRPAVTEPIKTEPKETKPVDYANVYGTYKLESVNGVDIATYFLEEMKKSLGEEYAEKMDMEEILAMSGFTMADLENLVTITINEDGTAVVGAMEEYSSGTWEKKGNKIVVTVDGEAMEFSYENGRLHIEEDGDRLVLSR